MIGGRDDARPATGRERLAPVAGVALLSLTIVLVAVGVVLLFFGGGFGRIVWGLPGVPGLWALGFSLAGYPITRRHPANPVGWCLMVAGVTAGVNLLGLVSADPEGPALLLVSAWAISVGALSSAVVLFPSGSPPSRWWWAQLLLLWGCGLLVYFSNPFEEAGGFIGPLGWLDPLAVPVGIVFQLSLAAGFFSLVVRWRRSGAVERLQLKWVVYGVLLVGTTALIAETAIPNLAPGWHLPATVALSIVILAVPVTMGVAMLRYRLYDIDLVINRTLVYGALTVTLALVYLAVVVSMQYAFRVVTGEGSQLVIVASTLGIAALFNPLRRRIQGFVDRLFYRRRYDAAKTLGNFSARLRDETDLDALADDLVTVVRQTMQPERVSLWLRRSKDGGKPGG